MFLLGTTALALECPCLFFKSRSRKFHIDWMHRVGHRIHTFLAKCLYERSNQDFGSTLGVYEEHNHTFWLRRPPFEDIA